MAWLADRLGSAASDRILAQLERSWDCPEPELWATFLCDRQAQQLIAKRAYDLDYLGILTDWHTRHSPESVVRDCRRAYALLWCSRGWDHQPAQPLSSKPSPSR